MYVPLGDIEGSLSLLRGSDCNYATRRAGKVQFSSTFAWGREREKHTFYSSDNHLWGKKSSFSPPLVPLYEPHSHHDWCHHNDVFLNSEFRDLACSKDQSEPRRGRQDASRKTRRGHSSSQTAQRSLWIETKDFIFMFCPAARHGAERMWHSENCGFLKCHNVWIHLKSFLCSSAPLSSALATAILQQWM